MDNRMSVAFWTDERVAGGFLTISLVIAIVALIVMIASGALRGFAPMVGGELAQVAPYAGTFRSLILMFALSWLVQLLGLGLLTRLLVRAGSGQLAVLALMLAIVATVLAVLWTTFRMSVELWAAEEAASTGSIPELFAPMRAWIDAFFRLGYLGHLLAGAGFGWAIARTAVASPALGWVAVVWSLLWFVALGFGGGPPAIPLLMPAVIGIALLVGG